MTEPTNNGGWQDVPNPTGAGTNVPPTAGPGYPPPNQPYSPPPPPGYAPPQAPGLSPTAAATIAYLTFIPAIVLLVVEPYKRIPFVRFHAIQCLGLTLASFVIGRLIGIFFVVSGFAGGSWTLAALIHLVVNLGFFIAWLVCIIAAAQGRWFKLPVLGDFAMKQAQS